MPNRPCHFNHMASSNNFVVKRLLLLQHSSLLITLSHCALNVNIKHFPTKLLGVKPRCTVNCSPPFGSIPSIKQVACLIIRSVKSRSPLAGQNPSSPAEDWPHLRVVCQRCACWVPVAGFGPEERWSTLCPHAGYLTAIFRGWCRAQDNKSALSQQHPPRPCSG